MMIHEGWFGAILFVLIVSVSINVASCSEERGKKAEQERMNFLFKDLRELERNARELEVSVARLQGETSARTRDEDFMHRRLLQLEKKDNQCEQLQGRVQKLETTMDKITDTRPWKDDE